MKKPASRKSSKAKPARKSPKPAPDDFDGMDSEAFALFRDLLSDELGLDPGWLMLEDPVELFRKYLELQAKDDVDDDEMTSISEELGLALDELRMDANGGSRKAREKIVEIDEALRDALRQRALTPVALMMTGKLLAEAEWPVPEELKQAVVEAAEAMGPQAPSADGNAATTLLELAEQADQKPFEIHELMTTMLASFPTEAMASLMFEIVNAESPVLAHAVAGFVLHSDPVIAQSASEALTAFAKRKSVESLLIERLVRMRPWLPAPRQEQLDATIRALRMNAAPPAPSEAPKLLKCILTICDGSGAHTAMATLKGVSRHAVATVLMKPEGVGDAMVLEDLTKAEMTETVQSMMEVATTADTDLAGVTRMLELKIADNVASGELPPFKLVELLENLGIGAIHPRPATSLEIFEELLADLPPHQTDAVAVARADVAILAQRIDSRWFEVGPELEELLAASGTPKQRAGRLLRDYLPGRRDFWARQCALSALALRGVGKGGAGPSKALALVGREIASGVPMNQIPLMRRVADASVRALRSRR